MQNEKTLDPRVVAELREWIGPGGSGVTDEELVAMTEGSLLRGRIDLYLAVTDLKVAIKKAVAEDWRRLLRFLGLKA